MTEPSARPPSSTSHRVTLAELEDFAQGRPAENAFALYDLVNHPEITDVLGWSEEGRLRGYLLIWRGDRGAPIVHCVGAPPPEGLVARLLPPRPFLAIVPAWAADLVEAARGPVRRFEVDYLQRPRGPLPPAPPVAVRRLTGRDRARLLELAQRHAEVFLAAAYARVDPATARVVAAESPEGELLAVARTQAEIPGLWLVGGVFTEPSARRRGWGTAVTAALVREAEAAGAEVGLYVRRDNPTALSIYRALGFRPAFDRTWVDAGTGRVP